MSNDVNLAASLIEAEARDQIKNAGSLEDKFKAAFKAAKNHWMFTDEDTRFRGAIGAVGISVGVESEHFEAIKREMASLNTLNAILSGVPVDFERLDTNYKPIGIIKLWQEMK